MQNESHVKSKSWTGYVERRNLETFLPHHFMEQFIADAEALAEKQLVYIEIPNVAPVYVPLGYEKDGERAGKLFPNGSTIHLNLLLF